ncbi:DUF6443 domain-containing protein, partial [Fulvivirga imtechensis]|uniref:DUF6443 domain-containing protein n=1 Tax=Fulvivirga imtechensis TaxID=881893 RepID=UPI000590D00A
MNKILVCLFATLLTNHFDAVGFTSANNDRPERERSNVSDIPEVCLNWTLPYYATCNIGQGTGSECWWEITGGYTYGAPEDEQIDVTWNKLGYGKVRRYIKYFNTYTNEYVTSSFTVAEVHVVSVPSSPDAVLSVVSYDCGSATLTYTGNPDEDMQWYWQEEEFGTSTSAASAARQYIAREPKDYYLRAKASCGWSNVSKKISVASGWKSIPGAPAVNLDFNRDYVTVTASRSTDEWYTSASGGSPFYTGLSKTFPKTDPGDYYIGANNNGCRSSLRSRVNWAGTDDIKVCVGDVKSYTFSCNFGQGTLQSCGWEVIGGTWTSNGDQITVTWNQQGEGSVVRTAEYSYNGQTYPIRAVVATVDINNKPAPPQTTFSITYQCGEALIKYNGSSSGDVKWYWQDSGGGYNEDAVHAANPYRVLQPKTYYLKAKNYCGWSNPISVSTVSGWKALPDPPVVTQEEACANFGGNTVTVTSSSTTDRWYTGASGGTPFYTGNSYIFNKTDTRTFYIEAFNGTCKSATRTSFSLDLDNCREVWRLCKDYYENDCYLSGHPDATCTFESTGGGLFNAADGRKGVSWTAPGYGNIKKVYSYFDETEETQVILKEKLDAVWIKEGYIDNVTIAATYSCGSAVLMYQGGPTEPEVTWFWQESDNGTSEASAMSGNALKVYEPKEYFLRAKSPCEWRTLASFIVAPLWEDCQFTITSINPLKKGYLTQGSIDMQNPYNSSINVQHYDGFGRVVQIIAKSGSPEPDKKDIVTGVEYDDTGRKYKSFLPYVSTANDGAYKPSIGSEVSAFYQGTSGVANDAIPYSVTKYEPSRANRLMEQGAPGEAWQPVEGNPQAGKTVKFAYDINTAADNVKVWIITFGTPSSTLYDPGQLTKTITTDEENHQTIEFVDKLGRTILKRVQVHENGATTEDWADTYYIYDDFGNLRFVLPPMANQKLSEGATINDPFLAQWAFCYKYDGRKRMIEKRVPGADWVYMVYDKRDRLVLTQDGNQRKHLQNANLDNEWTFTKYDALNRPINTGILTDDNNFDQADMQVHVNGRVGDEDAWYETRGTTVHGYTDQSYPTGVAANDYLTVTYYDDYTFKNLPDFGAAYNYSVPTQLGSQTTPQGT